MKDWKWQQQHAIRDVDTLRRRLPWLESDIAATIDYFKLQITPYYLDLIENTDDPDDPIALQCIPQNQELNRQSAELSDPIGDRTRRTNPVKGIVHRYPDRALLLATPICSSYCRFCFRREIVSHNENHLTTLEQQRAINYIENHSEIREVILSGGDVLIFDDDKLLNLLRQLSTISHLRSIRIHSRFPVFNPYRLTDSLIAALDTLEKPLWLVTHVNHHREVTDDFKLRIKALIRATGIGVLNQGVLLKGVNDDIETLKALAYALNDAGIKPYYMHYPDLALGTGHFRPSLEKSRQLFKSLKGQLSGYLIPDLILDIPKGHGKISLTESFIENTTESSITVRSPLSANTRHYSIP